MKKVLEFIENVEGLIVKFKQTQLDAIQEGANLLASCLMNDGMIYTFGTGHSHMLAEEIFYRAGGLVRVNPILEEGLMLHSGALKSTALERMQGYSAEILKCYPVKQGDVIIIASNSGRNAATVEMAIEARKQGMKVIALTSLNHSKQVTSRHPSGKRLFELADVVVDNCGVQGDASVAIEGVGKISPTSTIIGCIAIHSLTTAAVEIMVKNGVKPETYASANTDGNDDSNESYANKYRGIIRSL